MADRKKPFALIIMDGYAHNPNPKGNAVQAAKKPTLDRLYRECPTTELVTWGTRVGLPEGQMGNSEVGHLNIGGGRVVKQELTRIDEAAADGSMAALPSLQKIFSQTSNTALHLIGLVSTGGVHSSVEHLKALVNAAVKAKVPRVYVHVITDGRDRPPTAAKEEIAAFESFLTTLPKTSEVKVADVIGRYYAMDRDHRWERTELAYDLLTKGTGDVFANSAAAIAARHAAGEQDEFLKPCAIDRSNFTRDPAVQDGDAVIFFNFRTDRMRQMLSAFLGEKVGFDGFKPKKLVTPAVLATLTEYDATFPVEVLFAPTTVPNHLGDVLSKAGLKQVRMAETEKYPHVTYFCNGGVEEALTGEERIMVPSPRDIPTYDFKPEMSAYALTDALLARLQAGDVDVVVINYANCDMVGHTGVYEAAVKAVETVDTCVGRVLDQLLAMGGGAIVTSDHGNADQMIDYDTGKPHTFHTMYPVPLIVVGFGNELKLRKDGALCDIAPTICDLLGLTQPKEMTGKSLILK